VLSQKISLQNKQVLICPLDWGLGHTARCVPLIKFLQEQKNVVTIACDPKQKLFLELEIDDVKYVDLFGYDVRYSLSLPLWQKIFLQFPRLSAVVRKEHKWLADFLQKNKVDVVISDNRFGLYNKAVESVFITHQVFVKAPFLSGFINYMNHTFIKRFNACWVVDFEEKERSLAGGLSHGKFFFPHANFIGPLSRFEHKEPAGEKKHDVLILLSGVEPQRELLEKKLIEVFSGSTQFTIALVRGTAVPPKTSYPKNFTVKNMVATRELEDLLLSSKNIICRSGYSSLMDLQALSLQALLIPTPGQTEQEYLAEYWNKKFGFKTLVQSQITKEAVLNLLS